MNDIFLKFLLLFLYRLCEFGVQLNPSIPILNNMEPPNILPTNGIDIETSNIIVNGIDSTNIIPMLEKVENMLLINEDPTRVSTTSIPPKHTPPFAHELPSENSNAVSVNPHGPLNAVTQNRHGPSNEISENPHERFNVVSEVPHESNVVSENRNDPSNAIGENVHESLNVLSENQHESLNVLSENQHETLNVADDNNSKSTNMTDEADSSITPDHSSPTNAQPVTIEKNDHTRMKILPIKQSSNPDAPSVQSTIIKLIEQHFKAVPLDIVVISPQGLLRVQNQIGLKTFLEP